MNAVALPALDGRTPLGFLAALGVLHLLTDHQGGATVELSWSSTDCTAVLSGPWSTAEDVAAELRAIVESIPDGGVLPELPVDLPPRGEAPDRIRLPRPGLRQLAGDVWAEAGDAGERWLASLVTDLSVDEKGRADISLFTAPSGKQSMRTMLQKPLDAVRLRPEVLLEALNGWRRYPGVTGEYLDHRVLFDASDAPDGASRERGVPGATWLALMSYPLLRTTAGPGGAPVTTGWHYPTPRERDRCLVYPLWTEPVDFHAALALLRHPMLATAVSGRPPASAAPLTVFLICAARRRRIPGRTFAGVLAPIPTDTSRRATAGARRGRPR
jgi:hypothetical protein